MKKAFAKIIVGILLLSLLLTFASNVNIAQSLVDWWPMFHHDLGHTAYSSSTAPTTNQLLWNYTTGYWVLSSPAVVDGRVYVGSDDDKVYCLNAADGAYIWSYTTGDDVDSSPAVVAGKVYVGSWDDNVYCLDAATGTFIWSYTTGDDVDSSPTVVDDKVYVGSWDDNVYCLDAATGTFIWSYTTGDDVDSSPTV
ncbi:PQQ-binding-like beta-propeller repeat protein, partial [Candidatus Bathyarchaeota archaeon]|nr:PQQ-binding-like beta-propeller repeat protein [Candidatus Bathyarchaeota archaeon]